MYFTVSFLLFSHLLDLTSIAFASSSSSFLGKQEEEETELTCLKREKEKLSLLLLLPSSSIPSLLSFQSILSKEELYTRLLQKSSAKIRQATDTLPSMMSYLSFLLLYAKFMVQTNYYAPLCRIRKILFPSTSLSHLKSIRKFPS